MRGKEQDDHGSVGSGLTPLVPSPSLANEPATPSGVKFSAPYLRPGLWTYDGHGLIWAPSLKGGETRVLDVRGWGYLTGGGHGALNLPGDVAMETQNAWGRMVVEAVNAHFANLEGVAIKSAADGEVRDARSAPNDRTQKETPSNHTEESKP